MTVDNSCDGLVAQLDEVWAALGELGRGLDDGDWGRLTPCPGWAVSAQYAHVIGTESMLLGRANPEVDPGAPAHVRNRIGGFNEVWVVALAARPRAEVLDLFDEVTSVRRQALAAMTEADFAAPSWTPVGDADYRRFMQIRTFDCWVHEQDVRDAVDRPGHDGGPVAEQAIDEIVRAAGFVVGKKAGVPAGSSVRFELTGPVERTVDVDVAERARVVDRLAGPPTTTLTLSSSAYARLSCGRVTADEVLAGRFGGVRITGDEAVGSRLLSSLAFTI